MKQLTPNAIKVISENPETTTHVLVQIESIDPHNLPYKGNQTLFEAYLNDGFTSRKVVLVNSNPILLLSKSRPIIRIKSWTTKGPLILIRECEIVYLDFKDLIGNPMAYDEYERNKYQNPRGNNQIVHNQTRFKISVHGSNKKSEEIAIKTKNKFVQHLQQQQQPIQSILQKPNESKLCSIKDLYPGIPTFKIKAKVIAKSNVFEDDIGYFFTIKLMDADQSKIQGLFFNEACDKFSSIINLGSVYTFSEGNIKVSSYSTSKQSLSYSITFKKYSQIQELQDDIQFKQAKIEIKTIQQVQNLQNDDKCNVLVIVKDIAPVQCQKLRNGETQLQRIYQIFDETESIEVRFYGEQAEQFSFKDGQSIILKQLRFKSSQDQKYLEGTTTTSVETFDEELSKMNRLIELDQWFNSQKKNIIKKSGQNLKDIEEEAQRNLGDINFKKLNEVRCVNVYMKCKHYQAFCKKCNRRCDKINENQFKCSSCQENVNQPVWKFLLRVRLIDESGSIWATFMDNQGDQLLNVKNQIYSSLGNEYQQIIEYNSLYQDNRYLLQTNIEKYQEKFRIKYEVIEILEADYGKEFQEMFKNLQEYIN